jgi:hypothetical protein
VVTEGESLAGVGGVDDGGRKYGVWAWSLVCECRMAGVGGVYATVGGHRVERAVSVGLAGVGCRSDGKTERRESMLACRHGEGVVGVWTSERRCRWAERREKDGGVGASAGGVLDVGASVLSGQC